MKKIILALFAFLLYSMPAFASMCNPADNIYDYLVPGCIRQDESYIATGTGTDVCVTAAKICSGTQIPNANLAAITGTSMVSGAALYNLSSTPSGAGAMPIVNGGTGQTSRQSSMDALFAASMSGTSGQALVSNGTDAVVGYPASLTISSMAQGDILFVDSTPKVNRLAAGTSGYFLETQGASANPTWAALPSAPTNLVLTGSVTLWAGTKASIPSGYLLCGGQAVSRTTYSALFTAISTIYGSGDGSTTFNVPNLENVTVVGADNDESSIPNSSITGSETPSSSAGNLPSTTISVQWVKDTTGSTGGNTLASDPFFSSTGNKNATPSVQTSVGYVTFGTGTNVVPPYQAMYYIIKT